MEANTAYPLTPPKIVERPVMLQSWKQLAYVHWRFDPEAVQQRLPAGLEADTYDGSAWVGLVPFHMQRIRLPRMPAIPYLGTFPETNVRTYVRGPDGIPGVWFDSLDISRLLPVLVARTTYRLPYMWSRMTIKAEGDRIAYAARRRWPRPRDATSTVVVRRGEAITEASPLERFLTARWGLYTRLGSHLAFAPVDHAAWPLERARLEHLEDEFVEAAGYPPPTEPPLVHFSTGVDVRIGVPRRLPR